MNKPRTLSALFLSAASLGLVLGCGGGSSSSTAAPVITSFTPTSGPTGTLVTVTGTGFSTATAVTVCGSALGTGTSYPENLLVSDSEITFAMPAVTTTGTVTVTNPGGTTASAQDFDVTPSITTISPVSGPALTAVTITGNGLLGVTGASFGATPVLASDLSAIQSGADPTQITLHVPTGATSGAVALTLSNNYGLSSATTSFTVTGSSSSTTTTTGTTVPSITSITPLSGLTGTVVTVSGTGFTGATAILLDGSVSVSPDTVTGDIQVTFTVPITGLSGQVTVVTPAGSGASASSFAVIPAISSTTPSAGAPGSSVIITGSGLMSVTQITFGGTTLLPPFSGQTANQIILNVPSAASLGPYDITLQNASSTNYAIFPFTVN